MTKSEELTTKNVNEEPKVEKKALTANVEDADYFEDGEEIGDATWSEVIQTCCCHSPQEWFMILVGLLSICFFLYFFLLGLDLLGSSAKVIGGCTAGTLLGDDTNPIAALMIGILATVLLQSSSTTTSIVVSLVGSNVVPTRQAIYMIMGANIGTSVTNTIVAMGQMGDGDQLERAFAGATVHDMFNFLTVAVLLPVEAATGYLYYLTKAMISEESVSDGEKWTGPVKKIVAPLSKKIIVANKKLIEEIAKTNKTCDNFYPISCEDDSNPTKKSCSKVGLIGCDKSSNECPAFFSPKASRNDDEVSGGVCFVISLVILVICLVGLVTILQKMLLGMSTRVIYKATNINGYIAMLVGVGITILVQSSSITTSTLTPLVGMGVLQLEAMLPLTLGANIGTTVTALLAALVSDSINSLQVALAHLFFNITGILIWYPVPFMRAVPLNAARTLGKATRVWRGFPIVYIIIMFFIIPLLVLGLASLFEQNTVGFQVLGTFLTILVFLGLVYLVYFWFYKGGKQQCIDSLELRQRKRAAIQELPDDMEYLKAKVLALSEHTGLPEGDDDEDGEDKAVEADTAEQAVDGE
eukprot:CAMPEP_0202444632 /NCGR_PEP_ID=MMETSP1360-20130828/3631_1 /ASSEMBLY_ACC=CAM_ASM_000848 /TAXON_ID=515479 /ORGANISM="Licmophora paradoxa, Strain CCMP2313" /LENGTH=582 /DNA_ID=CAMNT_0049060661 /DNA_START=88 /DNA_END=1836 /DNA_ORIENTATION=-